MEQLFICWQFSYIVTIRPILHRQIFVIKQTGYYIQGQNKLNISIVSQPRYAAPTTYSNISNQSSTIAKNTEAFQSQHLARKAMEIKTIYVHYNTNVN